MESRAAAAGACHLGKGRLAGSDGLGDHVPASDPSRPAAGGGARAARLEATIRSALRSGTMAGGLACACAPEFPDGRVENTPFRHAPGVSKGRHFDTCRACRNACRPSLSPVPDVCRARPRGQMAAMRLSLMGRRGARPANSSTNRRPAGSGAQSCGAVPAFAWCGLMAPSARVALTGSNS